MIKNKYFFATVLMASLFSINVWADCTVTSQQNTDDTFSVTRSCPDTDRIIIYQGNLEDYTITDDGVVDEGIDSISYKEIRKDSNGNPSSAQLGEYWITAPSEIEGFSITPDYSERHTDFHYDINNNEIIDRIEYWGTSDKGEWNMVETYNGTLLVTRSAQWEGDGDDPEGESFEITYTYNDNGNLIFSTETRYAMNDDWDWDQTSSQTKTYKVSKPKKRIYTVEEASKLVKPTGNTFKIRYR